MDFSSLPGAGAFLFIGALLAALIATVVGTVLKLVGVLLLSWWWIASPVPVVAIGALLLAGLFAVFGS